MADLVPQVSMVHPDHAGPKDLKETKVHKEIRDHLGLKAKRALMDPREIPVNPSQLLLFCHLQCLRW